MRHTTTHSQSGMTMIEMIMFIAIAGLVIGFAIQNFGDVLGSTEVQNASKNLLSLRIATAEVNNAEPDYSNLSTSTAVSLGIFPSNMVKGNNVHNAFGGDVSLAPNADSRYFDITYTQVPEDACSKMALLSKGEWESVTVNGSNIPQTGSATQAVASSCTAGNNTIVYTAL